MSLSRNRGAYFFAAVMSGKSSVRNGEAGKFALLYKLTEGLSAHA